MNRWYGDTSLLAFASCLLWLTTGGVASADMCRSITIDRMQGRTVGQCMATGTPCNNDAACTEHSRDYCVHGILADDPSRPCYGGDGCLEHITFEFDREYPCGRFVNGDPWVVDDGSGVTITRITPDHLPGCEDGGECRHGWEVGQLVRRQSLSSYAGRFQARTPALPYTVDASETPVSILKGIDTRIPGGCHNRQSCFLHAGVLTIVGAEPPADAFRPHFSGPDRPGHYHVFCDVNLGRLPSLPIEMAPAPVSISQVSQFFSTPFLGKNDRNSSLQQNMTLYQSYLRTANSASQVSGYHGMRSVRINDALLRLLFSDFDPAGDDSHRLALARAIQLGIDLSGMAQNWQCGRDGGCARIKATAIPIAFASFMLGDAELATTGFPSFSEMDTILDSPRASEGTGDVLWGHRDQEDTYWTFVTTGDGNKWVGDPYGYIDPGPGYQSCCSSGSWRGGGLLLELLRVPDRLGDLHLGPFVTYMSRWTEFGYHTAPDPCAPPPPEATGCVAPDCPGYGVTWGPAPGNSSDCHLDGTCECIRHDGDPMTAGRSPLVHGDGGGGSWSSTFANAMWDTFHACAQDCSCPGMVCLPTDAPCDDDSSTMDGGATERDAEPGMPDAGSGDEDAAVVARVPMLLEGCSCTLVSRSGGVPIRAPALFILAMWFARRRLHD